MKTSPRSRLRRLLSAPLAAALAFALAPQASAQPTTPPTRGAPILRTPAGRKPDATQAPGAGATPNAPKAGGATAPGAAATGAAAAGGTGAQGAGGTADDPMAAANVKTAPKEIDFKPKPGNFGVNFNLDDADLPDLVKAISNITGKRFIYGGKLKQIKATVYSPEKVTAAEAYSAFLSILTQNGMTVIPHGRFLKIIETPGVVSETTPLYGTATPVPDEDRYLTRLYRLAHIDANEAAALLGKFKSKEGDISVYPQGNLLIITETGANVQRLLRIVEEIDVGGAGEQIYVEPVNYTSAADIANKLSDLLDLKKGGGGAAGPGGAKGGGGGGGGARIVSDDRSNSLIIVATDPDYRRLLELINRLDVKQTGEGEIHVLPLQYAACKDLSQTLNSILGTGGLGGAGRPGSTSSGLPSGARPGTPGAAGSGIDEVFEGRIRVTCDEATNSIVTTSSLRDYAQLRNVIDQLDKPRRQVFIEAVIMDVGVNNSLTVDLSYHGGAPFNTTINGATGTGLFYAGNNALVPGGWSSATFPPSSSLEALAIGVKGPDIQTGTGLSIPALGVALHAVAKSGDSNVLSTPHILATDNIPAEISIGQNIPLQTNIGGLGGLGGLGGAAGGAAGALGGLGGLGLLGGGFGAVQRQDVGTKVKIVPHVNDSDQVRLELTEEISEAGDAQGALGVIPINKRTANTTLIVRDQQTVVIGGLMRDVVTTGETKIPILGDIPVLGLLFKQKQRKVNKTNLLLILTPYVIRTQDDLRGIFERKMQERQEFLDRYFVFNDSVPWEPPRDFSRANGLVEDIRQSIVEQEEKTRLEQERTPKARKVHEPGQPIPMPSLGGRGSPSGDDSGAPPPGVGAPPNVPPGGAGNRPRVRINPAGNTPNPRPVDRVE